ncbi:MAG: hypothetical protein V1839_04215 [archaeon]
MIEPHKRNYGFFLSKHAMIDNMLSRFYGKFELSNLIIALQDAIKKDGKFLNDYEDKLKWFLIFPFSMAEEGFLTAVLKEDKSKFNIITVYPSSSAEKSFYISGEICNKENTGVNENGK